MNLYRSNIHCIIDRKQGVVNTENTTIYMQNSCLLIGKINRIYNCIFERIYTVVLYL